MPHCSFSDPVDRQLHAAGVCLCALYTNHPPMKQLSVEEAGHLAGLFGFTLHQLDNGLWVARDAARGIQTPDGASIDTAHATETLNHLVVRARCADSLAGPMTIAEATDALARLGFALRGGHHKTFGHQWWATSQDREQTTMPWSYLKDVVAAARSLIIADQVQPVKQERMLPLTRQLEPVNLDPKPRQRTPPPPPARPPDSPLPERPGQLSLGLDVDWSPPRRPDSPPRRRRKR